MKYFLLFLLLCLGSGWIFGQSASPYFLVTGDETRFPLESTTATANIAGVIADVTVEQVYTNDGDQPIEATYVFPASTEAAVHGMEMQIGDRLIVGEVQRKVEARQTYETAKAQGRRTSLLEQHRPNVFQMSVANILPGDSVKVRLRYTELLVPEGGTYRFVYPTVVGPRFTGEDPKATSFAAQPYVSGETTPNFDLQIDLAAGMPLAGVESPTHRILTQLTGDGEARVRLDPAEQSGGNRDFVLAYRLGGQGIHTGLLLYEGEKENFFLYMAQPPASAAEELASAEILPREFVFIVDVSGSMSGFPLDVTKNLMADLVADLRAQDYFNILLFAGAADTWRPASVPATPANLNAATEWLDGVRGGGGTELLSALNQAYALPGPSGGGWTGSGWTAGRTTNSTGTSPATLSRNFVIVTDGYISVEPEVFDLIDRQLDKANVYTFGIGSSVNRHLIDGMARVGRGRPAVVLDHASAGDEAARFREYISRPLLTDVHLSYDGFDAYDLEPLSLPDLGTERPLIVFGKYRGKARGELVLSGLTSAGELRTTQRVRNSRPNKRNGALAYLWARSRVQRLDDYNQLHSSDDRIEEVTSLGLDYNLLTAYTSFVAVDKTPVRTEPGSLETVKQPLPLPLGVSANAVGFSLAIAGVSGLPEPGCALPWWSYATVAAVLLIFLVGFRKLRSLTPLLVLLAALTGCSDQPSEVPEQASDTPLKVETGTIPDEPIPVTATLQASEGAVPEETVMERQPAIPYAANDITFILGRDQSDNPYYAQAKQYFREQGQENMVEGLESLAAVRYYLDSRRPRDGWGRHPPGGSRQSLVGPRRWT